MQELYNQLWAVSVLNYIFFSLRSLKNFWIGLHASWFETWGRPFKTNGVIFSGTSVYEEILLHTRLGRHLISSPFCGRCNHLEFLSASISVCILFLFYFYFVLLTLALFCWKRKAYTFWKEDVKKKCWKMGKGDFFFPSSLCFSDMLLISVTIKM